ncbi:hypothetical protein [Luteimonas terrae]|uniref:Restriction endonuclease n=1 Tax=Luteimonas terrae TaxID=1530191 RepID=A0ABU1Y0N1_9GAMM|nr:hypothetical protein [Luteimonas terrae]MDR7194579.1 hypothetical protein [Luteimonas terrae]
MAKLRNQPLTSTEIARYLSAQDDFALEMQVYSLALSHGYEASHGGTYEDPVTKKPRQYDIRANTSREDHRIDLAIECKSLKSSYPIVVSRIPRMASEAYHQVVCSLKRERGPFYTHDLTPSETLRIENQAGSPMYPEQGLVGKSTVQIGISDKGEFVSGDAEVYDKWSQALASLAELASDACWYRDTSESGFHLTALFPVLVVPDGTLWVADYDISGKLLAEPHVVEETTIFMGREYWSAGSGSYNVSHLHVCTLAGIDGFMHLFRSSDNAWERLFPMKEVLERLTEA